MKPANILINSEGFVKLTDFGITKTLENTAEFCTTFVGTKNYMSPERILGNEYSYASDIWSLGLIVYELATANFPYNFSKVFIEHLDCILKEPEPTLPTNGRFSPELQNFVSRCLRKKAEERDSIIELCAHPWILKYSDRDANLELWLAKVFDCMIIDD
jgi:serine/threonine protein kinase